MPPSSARPDPKEALLTDLLALVERGEAQAAALVRVAKEGRP
jgi:hypothetical protein